MIRRDILRILEVLAAVLAVWYVLAYWILPTLWRHYEHHPSLEKAPKTAVTKEGIPGDALNIALIGSEHDVVTCMLMVGWEPADPTTFKTSLRIASSSVFGKPYPTAPVSNLYVFGRVEDLAFEQSVPGNTKQRHHVRFWKSEDHGHDGRPLWIGAATFDRSVGISHLTGKITHHISPDIDAERDKLADDLRANNDVARLYQVTGVGSNLWLRNGGGDKYYTDGELTVAVLNPAGNSSQPEEPQNPVAVKVKNGVWTALKGILRRIF